MLEYDNSIFASNLKKLMQEKGIGQRELARQLGISATTVSGWCNGLKVPRMGKIETLSAFFHVEKSDLIEEHYSSNHDNCPRRIFQNLKALRLSKGLTQAKFAESVGVSKTTYNNYEKGIREPGSNFWIAVAEKYGVTIDYLMGFSDTPSPVKDGDRDQAAQKRLVKLTGNFDQMNETGQEKLVDHSDLLLHDETLHKNFQPESVEKEA